MKKPASRTAPVDGLERLSSQPFLTDDQRAVLDATLAKKQTTGALDGWLHRVVWGLRGL